MHPAEEGAYRGPNGAGWIQVWKEEFRLSKKLKLFGLLALTVVLAAGVAWAASKLVVLPAGSDSDLEVKSTDEDNVITGNGTFVANITQDNGGKEALKLEAAEGNTVTIAPKTGNTIKEGVPKLQVLVNAADDATGTVVMKASNGDNPTNADYTLYNEGTLLVKGVLGVTNSNSLGEGFIAVEGGTNLAKAPIFRVAGANAVTFGNPDPAGLVTHQPFFLAWKAVAGAEEKQLRFVKFDIPHTSASSQGLILRHGLDQREYSTAYITPRIAADTYAEFKAKALDNHYVRLVKTGDGRLYVNGGIRGALSNGAEQLNPVDGAFHRGGTTVEGGVLEVMSEADANTHDHFRASLGRTWTMVGAYNGSELSYTNLESFKQQWGKFYNPLKVANNGKVKLNKSQFFTDFNIDEKATFQADDYTLASSGGKNSYPQIAVVLGERDSYAKGLLTGEFDLVLNSVRANELTGSNGRPSDDDKDNRITKKGYAVLYIENESNTIGAERETEIAEGVLEIAGAKSIGGGQVDVGASEKRGFGTEERGVFAASKSFRLPNTTLVHTKGMLAAEAGTELSFKNVTIHNRTDEGPDGSTINPRKGEDAKYFWSGTVTFGPVSGDEGDYFFEGTIRNPSIVTINKGVWQLNSYPSMDVAQVVNKENPYASVTINPDNATLSLGDGARDFSKYMTLTVNDDSRIRVVLNADDIAGSRADAMGKNPVFHVRLLDVSGTVRAIGAGQENRDHRLEIQLDASKIGNAIKAGWVKVFNADDAIKWNDLHFLREQSSTHYEDYAKVRVTWSDTSDLPADTKAVAHLDENSNTILIQFGANVTDPVNPNKPTPQPETPKLTATVTPASGTTVKPGTDVVFEVKDWKYEGKDVEVENVKWMLNGEDKTADVKSGKLTAKAGANGTKLELKVTANVKGDAEKKAELASTVTVSDGSTPTPPSDKKSSGGGCDAGFGGLALALAAAFLLKRKA